MSTPRKIFKITLFTFCASFTLVAQQPEKWNSAQIHEAIKKLNVLGTALYIAAHPDDENTRLIAYLSNELKMNTAYLSLTRGDGGQNLIGPEIRELLGVIRTQELLMARSVDGGKQFFSRANDFGYSKTPSETLAIWEKDEVMADVVWTIRKFRPDIIVNRFSHDTSRKTHGHHTSSAMLSHEAFDLVGDKSVYPEQLKYVDAWQPQRLFFNTSWWFYGSREKFAEADKSKMMSVDVGVYYPMKGKSNTEIAALSRSMHRCQGFGSTGTRGSKLEYMQLLKGDMPPNKEDPFEGINTTWTRVTGGAPIGKIIDRIDQTFKADDPAASLPELVKAFQLIEKIEDDYWKEIKGNEIKQIIAACAGLYIEAVADTYNATRGQQIELQIEAISQLGAGLKLESVQYLPSQIDSTLNLTMEANQAYEFYKQLTLPIDISYTNAYWLNEKSSLGMYTVEDQLMRGLPETPRPLEVVFNMKIEDCNISFTKEVVYKENDPVMGEVYRPFEITPTVSVELTEQVYVFAGDESKKVDVIVKAGEDNVKGVLELCHPSTWKVTPEKVDFEMSQKGAEQKITFELFPSKGQEENFIVPLARIGEQSFTQSLVSIEYDHIPTQTILQDASAKVVKVELETKGKTIAYVMGAGDAIPESLEQVGFVVDLLDDKEISLEKLKNYDALIIGIRAYNTVDRIKFHQKVFMDYVKQGGTMIVQYNTGHRLKTPDLAPYDLKISRDRVAVEEAEIRVLEKEHGVMNFPNKITNKDFDNWVQERGLYFPDEWDEKFTAILSSNDPGETPKNGGLLVAPFGKGYYVYSGYSWFRQLPAGVPGAYRIFANMIAIGQEDKP